LLGAAVPLLFFGVKKPSLVLCAVMLASASVGILREDFWARNSVAESLAPLAHGQKVAVEGTIVQDPDERAASVRVTMSVVSVGDTRLPAGGRGTLLAVLPAHTVLAYGDHIVVRGVLELPRAFVGETGNVFDYPSYLKVQGVSALLYNAALVSKQTAEWSFVGSLYALKRSFNSSLERILPEPDASLMEGILLGERRGIPASLTHAFIVAGLVHVVVLSGYNISVVSEGVFRALAFLPRAFQFSFGGALMILFALMTGAGSTTLRALAMALIALLARYLHRTTIALRSLCVAAGALALWNPPALLYDPSFILSVLATFGLITLSPFVESHLPKFFSKVPSVRSIVASTISVQIFVLPALLYFTGIFSYFALPANVLALPVVSFAMLGGFLGGMLAFVHPALAFLPALVSAALLRWMMLVANTAAVLPFSSAIVASFPAWAAALCYVPLTALAVYLYRTTEK
jgi:competence protein ComEC